MVSDYDPEVLKQAVNDAVANIPVPADGKSITPDDVRPMLEQMVKEAVSHIPAPLFVSIMLAGPRRKRICVSPGSPFGP